MWVLLLVALIGLEESFPAESPEVTWEEPIEVARGGGFRGPWLMNESEFHYVDDPTVAINRQGFIGVAWVDQTQKDIFFQLYAPDGTRQLERPVNVSRTPRVFSWLPRMAMTSTDPIQVYFLWQEIVFSGGTHGGEIFFARSEDGGKTFSDPLNLSNSIAGDGKGRLTTHRWDNGSLDLSVSPDGHLYAAWTEYEGTLWFSRSTDGGRSFSKPLRVAGGGREKPARGPSLTAGPGGTVYLAFSIGEDPAANIHLAKSTDHGESFDEPQAILKSGGHSDAPKIAVDLKSDTVHLVYAESPTGPFGRYRVYYTRSGDRARTFVPPREISSPPIEGYESAHFPALSVTGESSLYLIWELSEGGERMPQALGFTFSHDGGRSFAPPSIVPGSVAPTNGFNGSQQGLLMRKLAAHEAGAIAIVHSTFEWGKQSRIQLLRGRATHTFTEG